MSFLRTRRKFVGATKQPSAAALQIQSRNMTVSGVVGGGGTVIARLPFTDGFESGNISAWDFTGGTVTVTTAQAYEGTRSATMSAISGQPTDNYIEYNFGDALTVGGVATGMNEIWIRFAHKWDTSYNDSGVTGLQKVFLLNSHNPSTGARRYQMTFNHWNPSGLYFFEFLAWLESGGFSHTVRPNIDITGFPRTKGIWEEFVFRVRMNNIGAADGILGVWTKTQNDSGYTQRINRTDINYRDSTAFTPNRIIQADYNTGTVANGARYWDGYYLSQTAYPTPPPPAGGNWADVFTTLSGVDAELTSAGRRVGVRGATMAEYGQQLTAGNGGSLTIIPNGSFDGQENAIRLVPPNALVGPNAQYVAFLGGMQLWNGGSRVVKQVNFGIMVKMASRYIDLASGPKWIGWTLSQTLGSVTNPKRIASFEGFFSQTGAAGRIFSVTYGTTQNYCEPEANNDDQWNPNGCNAAGKPIFVINGAANHTNDPPFIGQEWFHVEHVVTAPGHDPAAPNGRNRLWFKTSDGVVAAMIDIPFTWGADYNPANQYLSDMEFFGGYFNTAGTAHADNYVDYSHPVVAINMGLNDLMGPPPGFLT